MDTNSIKHFHLNECSSTQQELENYILKHSNENNHNIVISTSTQNKGIGRHGNHWDQYPGSLALSCTISPNHEVGITPLELGLLIVKFFSQNYNQQLKLKWPNDVLTQDGDKCGGIICTMSKQGIIMAGIGINLFKPANISEFPTNHYKLNPGFVFNQTTKMDQKLAKELYQFILHNRLSTDLVKLQWRENCFHLNKMVRIENGNNHFIGTFIDIGESGEAILLDNSGEKQIIYAGSLFIHP